MTRTKEVRTSVGVWVLKRPKAGIRNKALKAAETSSGQFKQVVLMSDLLAKCIQQRPDGYDTTVPIEQQLDDLELEDYDLLTVGLTELMTTSSDKVAAEKSEEEKKTSSKDSLNQQDSQSQENTKQ